MRRSVSLLALGVLLAGLAAGGGYAISAGHSRSAGRAGGLIAGARLLGATDVRTPVDFSFVLRQPGRARLRRFLTALYDPRSPAYHHFLSAEAFGRRFGLPAATLRATTAALGRDGVQVTAAYPQRTSLAVRASAGTVERLLGVRLLDYLARDGRRFHVPVGAPVLPSDLSGAISAVAGLDGRAAPLSEDIPSSGLEPAAAALAYDIAPLHAQGISGQGEKIAIISFASFSQSDVDRFDQQFQLPQFTPVNEPLTAPTGGATDSGTDSQGEVELDLEVSHEIAPAAEILDYNSPQANASGADALAALINKIVADGQANVVSDSWGTCELSTAKSDIQLDEQALQAAAAHGISIFKSTGDAGAYQCQRDSGGDHRLSVEWPASSPWVIAVGGTSLALTQTSGYAGETAWEDTLSQGGGGGGLSVLYPRPSWQSGPGVSSQYSNGARQIPDVSADADPATGWATVTGGQVGVTGGTSAASPFWAGAMALVDQYARQHGVKSLGFIDPTLYAIAATPQRVAPFHDVTVGGNRFYPATSGWDFATGLGSPDVYHLAQDIVAYAKSHGG